jgi:hypothetical protein
MMKLMRQLWSTGYFARNMSVLVVYKESPSDIPMTMSRMKSEPVKCRSMCSICILTLQIRCLGYFYLYISDLVRKNNIRCVP